MAQEANRFNWVTWKVISNGDGLGLRIPRPSMEGTNMLGKRIKQGKYLYRLLVFQSLLKVSGQTDQLERGPGTICPLHSALTGRCAVARGTLALEP